MSFATDIPAAYSVLNGDWIKAPEVAFYKRVGVALYNRAGKRFRLVFSYCELKAATPPPPRFLIEEIGVLYSNLVFQGIL